MRAVSKKEGEYISGGDGTLIPTKTLGGVTVTATASPWPVFGGFGGFATGGGDGAGSWSLLSMGRGVGGGGGGGGIAGGIDWTHMTISQTTVDHDAKDLSNEINSKADHDSREYLGFVYVGADGQVHESNLVEGGDSVTVGDALQQLGISADDVVDMVHNHPVDVYGRGDPSSRAAVLNDAPSVNDWNAHDTLIQEGADPNFGIYIDGPDDVTRYYNGLDRTDPTTGHAPTGRVI